MVVTKEQTSSTVQWAIDCPSVSHVRGSLLALTGDCSEDKVAEAFGFFMDFLWVRKASKSGKLQKSEPKLLSRCSRFTFLPTGAPEDKSRGELAFARFGTVALLVMYVSTGFWAFAVRTIFIRACVELMSIIGENKLGVENEPIPFAPKRSVEGFDLEDSPWEDVDGDDWAEGDTAAPPSGAISPTNGVAPVLNALNLGSSAWL